MDNRPVVEDWGKLIPTELQQWNPKESHRSGKNTEPEREQELYRETNNGPQNYNNPRISSDLL